MEWLILQGSAILVRNKLGREMNIFCRQRVYSSFTQMEVPYSYLLQHTELILCQSHHYEVWINMTEPPHISTPEARTMSMYKFCYLGYAITSLQVVFRLQMQHDICHSMYCWSALEAKKHFL